MVKTDDSVVAFVTARVALVAVSFPGTQTCGYVVVVSVVVDDDVDDDDVDDDDVVVAVVLLSGRTVVSFPTTGLLTFAATVALAHGVVDVAVSKK